MLNLQKQEVTSMAFLFNFISEDLQNSKVSREYLSKKHGLPHTPLLPTEGQPTKTNQP